MKLSEQELREIKARTDAATQGPYERRGNAICLPNGLVIVELPTRATKSLSNKDYLQMADDYEFFAHARTDIPRLLKHIELLNLTRGVRERYVT